MSNYSIAIRTLGTAGEKYKKLLSSIANSKLQPEKIVVVLPKGYNLPNEKIGTEEFVFCDKSMIQQRIEALKYINSKYTLFLDDDVAFDADFVSKLLEPLEKGDFDCSVGPLFSFFPQSFAGKIVGTLTGSVAVSVFHRDKYVKILRTGGWSYRTVDTSVKRFYQTESFAWTCFMIRTDVMRNLQMEQEKIWLEKFGYAAGDDRVMSYKLIKLGYRACVVSNALYEHNDAKTSKEQMVNTLPIFCMHYMHVVFWKRFIQLEEQIFYYRIFNIICFGYWSVMMAIYQRIKAVNPSYRPFYKAFLSGYKAGIQYTKSEEFLNFPPIGNAKNGK